MEAAGPPSRLLAHDGVPAPGPWSGSRGAATNVMTICRVSRRDLLSAIAPHAKEKANRSGWGGVFLLGDEWSGFICRFYPNECNKFSCVQNLQMTSTIFPYAPAG